MNRVCVDNLLETVGRNIIEMDRRRIEMMTVYRRIGHLFRWTHDGELKAESRQKRAEDRWLVFRSAAWALTVHRISQNVRLFEVKFSPSCSPSHAPTDFPSLCRLIIRVSTSTSIPHYWEEQKWKFEKIVLTTR